MEAIPHYRGMRASWPVLVKHPKNENLVDNLYKDNDLTCFENKSRPKLEKNKKKIRKFFKDKGLNIAINVSFHIANYLDVKFNLTLGKFYPHRKQNSTLHYIHNQSNHPS